MALVINITHLNLSLLFPLLASFYRLSKLFPNAPYLFLNYFLIATWSRVVWKCLSVTLWVFRPTLAGIFPRIFLFSLWICFFHINFREELCATFTVIAKRKYTEYDRKAMHCIWVAARQSKQVNYACIYIINYRKRMAKVYIHELCQDCMLCIESLFILIPQTSI